MSTPDQVSTPPTDEASAATAIEGLLDLAEREQLDLGDDQESDEGQQPEVDAAPDESPASEDEDTDEVEPEVPAIDPPRSWTADEQARFRELPPELQHVVARRESERDTAISTRMSQLAEQRKAIEAEAVQATQLQTQYAQTLQVLIGQSFPELQQLEQVDLARLADTDPTEAMRLTLKRDGLRQRVNFMVGQYQHAEAQKAQQMQGQYQARLADEYQRLIEEVPEFNDPTKARAIVEDITTTMSKYGFNPQELAVVADARVVKVMARLAELEKRDAARKSAMGKKGGAPAPKVLTQNAAPSRETNVNKKLDEQRSRFAKSKSREDAARLIEMMI